MRHSPVDDITEDTKKASWVSTEDADSEARIRSVSELARLVPHQVAVNVTECMNCPQLTMVEPPHRVASPRRGGVQT